MTNDSPLGPFSSSLPTLAGEDHVCPACALHFADVDIVQALTAASAIPDAVRATVGSVSDTDLRRRPAPDVWSALEYVCHLRDVYATYTIRLHRARTENSPAVEPMFSDLRAVRFRYAWLPLAPVLDELDNSVAGFGEEARALSPEDWERTVSRRPDEVRTARWLVRQAMHEGRHHLNDIQQVLERLGAS